MIDNPNDALLLRRLLRGDTLNGELASLSGPFRWLGAGMNVLPAEARLASWNAFLSTMDDSEAIIRAVANADPDAALVVPAAGPVVTECATLADIARIVKDQRYVWKDWIPAGVLTCVAAEPGTGKTRFAMDLARRLGYGLEWPDGQPNSYPEGTRTLWIQGDRNFAEMLQVSREFGLPPDAVALATGKDDPLGGLDLDDMGTLEALHGWIIAVRPALVIIDTVGMTTSRNLCKPEDSRAFFSPLLDLANTTSTSILALTHLSKDKDPLGRRIVEKARSVIKITQPDPEGQPNRRRLWVDKTAVEKPPPLGVTMGTEGNEYDSNPPSEPDPIRPRGPAPVKTSACERWLVDRLAGGPVALTDLRREAEAASFDSKTLYNARDRLNLNEALNNRRKYWNLPKINDV